MKEYDEVRSNLINMLEELDERLTKITQEVKHQDAASEHDFSALINQSENEEVLDYVGTATRAERDRVQQAIERIDNGEYGICELCGDPIKKERLAAIPYSSMCVKCASHAGC